MAPKSKVTKATSKKGQKQGATNNNKKKDEKVDPMMMELEAKATQLSKRFEDILSKAKSAMTESNVYNNNNNADATNDDDSEKIMSNFQSLREEIDTKNRTVQEAVANAKATLKKVKDEALDEEKRRSARMIIALISLEPQKPKTSAFEKQRKEAIEMAHATLDAIPPVQFDVSKFTKKKKEEEEEKKEEEEEDTNATRDVNLSDMPNKELPPSGMAFPWHSIVMLVVALVLVIGPATLIGGGYQQPQPIHGAHNLSGVFHHASMDLPPPLAHVQAKRKAVTKWLSCRFTTPLDKPCRHQQRD